MSVEEKYNTPNSGCCGRPMQYATESQCNYTDACMDEYCCPKLGSIKETEPDCRHKAVIPSVTVESVEGITNLANCLVHVNDINTTFYVDDKHRIMITWAGPANIPGYDMENNPNGYRDQIVTDIEKGIAVIYDKKGKGFTFGIYESLDADGSIAQAINDKLDEMAANGTLEEIISDYIGEPIFGFDTVADMKASTTLQVGDKARTLGFHSINDGGGALYKITDTGTANEMDVIAIGGTLKAHIIKNQTMNLKQFGADGAGQTDIASTVNVALSNCDTLLIPSGNYLLTDAIHIPESKTVIGEKENTIITYNGTGRAFICDGRYITFKNFKLVVDTTISSSNPKTGITVDSRYSEVHVGDTLTNIIIETIVFENFDVSIALDNMWQVTIRNCVIKGLTKGTDDARTCYGIQYINSNTVISNWSGSGNIIESTHIQRCSHGLHIEGGWNVTLIDSIIENCYCSLYCNKCWRTVLINGWFEANDTQPVLIDAPTIMIGSRKGKLTDTVTDEFPSNLNNLHIIDTNGTSTNIYNQKLMSTIPNTQAMISGVKDQVPVGTPTDIVSLRSYTSRFNVIQNQNISNNFLTGELTITGHSDLAQNGRSYSTLQFKSGTTNASEVGVPLRTVFNIDRDGGITNPSSNGSVNIGSPDNMYKFGYFNNIILKGDNNNFYKIGVNSSGVLTATQV